MRILILDRTAPDVEATLASLRQGGLRFTHEFLVDRGDFNRRLADGCPFDAILSEVDLGDWEGIEVLQDFRSTHPMVPFIVVSHHEEDATVTRFLSQGATDYIFKSHLCSLPHALQRAVAESAEYRRRQQAEEALAESERHNNTILSALPDLLMLHRIDGLYQDFAATEAQRVTQIHKNSFGSDLNKSFPESIAPLAEKQYHTAIETGEIQTLEYSLPLDGEVRFFEARLVPCDDNQILSIVRDVTHQKKVENALRESEERYTLAARAANDALWDCELPTGRIFFSPRWAEMLGYEEHEITDLLKDALRYVHEDERAEMRAGLRAHLSGNSNKFCSEHRVRRKDSTYMWVMVSGLTVRNEHGVALRLIGSITDITDRKVAEQQLLHDAYHDGLTDLPNRALLLDRLRVCINRANRHPNYQFAVLFMDLDRFKNINDSLGHLAGDMLLQEFSRRIQKIIRPEDTLARLGGDEFVLLLDEIENEMVPLHVANRIKEGFQQAFEIENQMVHVTTSIGIAIGPSDYSRPDHILRDADTAMYHAKECGRDRFSVFDEPMHQRAVNTLDLESALRGAVGRNELELYYQPIMNINDGSVAGFEALVRWNHPKRGLISPAEFIPIAEDTGMIVEVGRWVLLQACHQLKQWQREFPQLPPLTMSVNASVRQAMLNSFPREVWDILEETQLPPNTLKIEITESVLMEQPEIAAPILSRLRELGVRLVLDDFGTGYSSLGYLLRFPMQELKIDRSFIDRIEHGGREAVLVQTIIRLAADLGMRVTAEGVENEAQLAWLERLGCDYAQGNYFSLAAPLPVAQKYLDIESQPA